jgi:ankyrin repeat protein
LVSAIPASTGITDQPSGEEVGMNLDQLRKQAKELVRAARAGDADALGRIHAYAPARERVILADAQLALAREQGFGSWPALVAGLEASAEAFVLAATEGRCRRAEALLAAKPAIERDEWAALVLGRRWEGDPNTAGGPREWAPLLYVCHSCFAGVELARSLLERGADPNVTFRNEYGDMSALYGAAGIRHDPELTTLLLEAGANPDDGESLYHATEAESPDCVRLLLEHGATTRGTNALAHALDYPRLETVRMLLEGGADPNEGPYMAHAVRRGRDPEFVRLLARFGADVDRPGGEMWRQPRRLRTPYQQAVLRGHGDVAVALAELGASTELDEDDAAVAAVARGERPPAPLPAGLDYDAQEALVRASLRGRLDVVVDAAGPDFAGVVGGSPLGTLLQHAAWDGQPDLVERLLERGADPLVDVGSGSPLGWAVHGSRHGGDGTDEDYIRVAELLAAAGNPIDPGWLAEAEGALHAWIEERS